MEFALIKKMNLPSYMSQGRGLTYCKKSRKHYASDGSNKLFEVQFGRVATVKKIIKVALEDGKKVYELNELECVGDKVWASIFMSTQVAVIDVGTGVAKMVDFEYLLRIANVLSQKMNEKLLAKDECLNGLAFDDRKGMLLVTGKNWPAIFRVDVLKNI